MNFFQVRKHCFLSLSHHYAINECQTPVKVVFSAQKLQCVFNLIKMKYLNLTLKFMRIIHAFMLVVCLRKKIVQHSKIHLCQ